MRSREVYVHAVDLATGVVFADLPADFLTALCDDVTGQASKGHGPALVLAATDNGGPWKLPGTGEAVTLAGPLAEITAYLTGRSHSLTTAGGEAAPVLAPWL
jgi:maleylpyruvate isomerase